MTPMEGLTDFSQEMLLMLSKIWGKKLAIYNTISTFTSVRLWSVR